MLPLTSVTTHKGRHYQWPTGKQYPSVTTIVKQWSAPQLVFWYGKQTALAAVQSDTWQEMSEEQAVDWLASAPTRLANEAAEVGIQAHDLIAKDLLDSPGIPNNWWEIENPYVTAARDFLKEFELTPLAVEVEVANENMGYAGTVDLVAKDPDDNFWIVDWKTGKGVYGRHALQMMAYQKATTTLDVVNNELTTADLPAKWSEATPIIVKLTAGGRWKAFQIRNQNQCFNAFKACHYLHGFPEKGVFL